MPLAEEPMQALLDSIGRLEVTPGEGLGEPLHVRRAGSAGGRSRAAGPGTRPGWQHTHANTDHQKAPPQRSRLAP